MLADITPIVLTWNEAPNIARTLDGLRWATEVLVVDSGSTDDTITIARRYPNVRVVTRAFDNFANQCNYAARECGITSPWLLDLDADYVMNSKLRDEIAVLQPSPATSGYRVGFRYAIDGRVLRGSLYPPRIVLYRRERGDYEQVGHAQRLRLPGEVVDLRYTLLHDDRKPDARWVASQRRYAEEERARLLGSPWRALRWRDRLRRARVITPWLVPLYVLFVQGIVLDGPAGWRYAAQRARAEWMIAKALWRGRA
jgi:glycosyltransferase involved in cell wall biosynthesis